MSIPHPDEVEQLPEIEKQWAVKAMHHAETYFNLITKIDACTLRLTKIDDEIYSHFRQEFPHLDVALLVEGEFKSPEGKKKWREFIMQYEKKIDDYNFGTLLRLDVNGDYTQENTMFGIS